MIKEPSRSDQVGLKEGIIPLNGKIKKKIKFEIDDISSHRCMAKTGNWCMDCEIANAKALGMNEVLEDAKKAIQNLKKELREDLCFELLTKSVTTESSWDRIPQGEISYKIDKAFEKHIGDLK